MSPYVARSGSGWIDPTTESSVRRSLALSTRPGTVILFIFKAILFCTEATDRSNKKRAKKKRRIDSSESISLRTACAAFHCVHYTADHCVHRVLGRPVIMRGRRSSALQVSLQVIADRLTTALVTSSPFAENLEKVNHSVSLVVIKPISK